MSTGSSGHDPKYTSFDPNALADGRRSNEWPIPKTQRSGGNKKEKEAARDPKAEMQSKKETSNGEKSASLILKSTLGIGSADVRSPPVQCCSRAPPKESTSALVIYFK
jgi:hypothetical protein